MSTSLALKSEISVKDLKRAKLVAGLREFADFLERSPTFPTTCFETITLWMSESSIEEFVKETRLLGKVDKEFSADSIYVIKFFGDEEAGVKLKLFMNKENFGCRKVVVGKKVVPAVTIPESEVAVYTWECTEPSILAKAVRPMLDRQTLDNLLEG